MNNNIFACFFVVFLGVFFLLFASVLSNAIYPIKYYNVINQCSNKYNVEKALIFSVVKAESGFNVNAISRHGAVGLMQLMPNTAHFIANKVGIQFDDNDLTKIDINIELGTAYLSYLLNKFNDVMIAICAYNAGEGEVSTWLNDNGDLMKIKYTETKAYLNKIKQAKLVYDEKLKYYL